MQPKESPPFAWLHFVLMTPLVGQPEFICMQSQRSAALLEAQAMGVVLQLPGLHDIIAESYVSSQYWVAEQVALPQLTPAGVPLVPPLVMPLVPPLVLALPGQSAVKPVEPAMSAQLLPSRHVS